MKYSMATPCKHCPFRTNIEGYLTKERVIEIAHSVLQGQTFPCHKTTQAVEEDDGGCDMQATDDSQECAGAAIFAAKHETSSQMSRIAGRLGMKVAKLNMRAKVCKSLDQMIEVHCGKQEGEPCEIVDDGCLAPAGYDFGGTICDGGETVTTTCDECGRYVCDNCSEVTGKGKKKRRACNGCREEIET